MSPTVKKLAPNLFIQHSRPYTKFRNQSRAKKLSKRTLDKEGFDISYKIVWSGKERIERRASIRAISGTPSVPSGATSARCFTRALLFLLIAAIERLEPRVIADRASSRREKESKRLAGNSRISNLLLLVRGIIGFLKLQLLRGLDKERESCEAFRD